MSHHSHRRLQDGFTLAEVLISSAMGAILITSLALATYSFTETLTQLEVDAGVEDPFIPAAGSLVADIREAWWLEVGSNAYGDVLEVSNSENEVTKYYRGAGDQLLAELPDGSVEILSEQVAGFDIDAVYEERLREGDLVDSWGTWKTYSGSGTPISVVVPSDGKLALAFVEDPFVNGERRLTVEPDVVSVPVRYIEEVAGETVTISLYESWAPFDARPEGSPLGAVTISGSSIPAASVYDDDGTEIVLPPTSSVSIDLSAMGVQLEPAIGYTLVFDVNGSSRLVFAGYPDSYDPDDAEVRVQDSIGANWEKQAVVTPLQLQGDRVTTSTVTENVVTQVTLTITPTGNRPALSRSASVLSQVVGGSDDPWLGVVPGEVAP